jgi:hypothetical protein
MTKLFAYSFAICRLFSIVSECHSADLNGNLSEDCQKIQANFKYNSTVLGGCQPSFSNPSNPMDDSVAARIEKLDRYYKRKHDPNVYSDGFDGPYEPKPKIPKNRVTEYEECFHRDFLRNHKGLVDPTGTELAEAFLNTRYHQELFRTPVKGEIDNNIYYLRRGMTPTKTPRRQMNLIRIQRGERPVWVNPADDRITPYDLHHLMQMPRGLLIMLPREVHKKHHKRLHPNPKGFNIDRGRARREQKEVFRKSYGVNTKRKTRKK